MQGVDMTTVTHTLIAAPHPGREPIARVIGDMRADIWHR